MSDRALWSSDEGRYAEIPREMMQRGDYVSPHLNHVRYFEKPPLAYWLTAWAYHVAGINEAAARFWPALLGALGLCGTWFFARRWFGANVAFWSTFFLLTCIGYFLVGRYLVLDMPFTFFFAMGLFCFLQGFEEKKKRYLAAAYVCFGLATLIKGIVAIVLPGMIVFLYLTWTRQWGHWRQTGVFWGLPLFALVVVPWFALISRANSTFLEFFFVHEHFQRFLTHSAGRRGPLYYFFGIGMLFFFPWSLFALFTGRGLCSWKAPQNAQDKKRLYLLISTASIFGFFTISRSKLPPYILPMLPPLAILTGTWVSGLLAGREASARIQKSVPVLLGIAFLALALGAIGLSLFLGLVDKPEKAYLEPFIWTLVALLVTGSGIAALLARRPKRLAHAFLTWGLTLLFAFPLIVLGMEKLDPLQSSKELSRLLNRHLRPQDTLAIYGGFEDFSDLPFYTGRRIMIVGTNIGELSYGSRLGDNKSWFLSEDAFREHLRQARLRGENVYCIAQENEYNELLEKGIQNLEVLHVTPKARILLQRAAGGPAQTAS